MLNVNAIMHYTGNQQLESVATWLFTLPLRTAGVWAICQSNHR